MKKQVKILMGLAVLIAVASIFMPTVNADHVTFEIHSDHYDHNEHINGHHDYEEFDHHIADTHEYQDLIHHDGTYHHNLQDYFNHIYHIINTIYQYIHYFLGI